MASTTLGVRALVHPYPNPERFGNARIASEVSRRPFSQEQRFTDNAVIDLIHRVPGWS